MENILGLWDMWYMRRIMQLFHQILKNAVTSISNLALIKAQRIYWTQGYVGGTVSCPKPLLDLISWENENYNKLFAY